MGLESTPRRCRWYVPVVCLPLVLFIASTAVFGQSSRWQRKVTFEMRDQPWERVLEWLSDNAGMPIVTSYRPQGTFNFIGTAQKTEYTLAEVIDIINDALLAEKYIMIRRPTSFIIVPADEPQSIDPSLIPRLTPDDLEVGKPSDKQKHGRTELAQVIFPLRSLTQQEAERDIKAVLGPFGKVAPIAKGNMILVTDTVGNLRRVKRLLDEIDGQAVTSQFDLIPLGTLDGAFVLKTLKTGFGIPETGERPATAPVIELDQVRNMLVVRGTPTQLQQIRDMVRKLGGPGAAAGPAAGQAGPGVRIINLERGDPTLVIENLIHLWSELRQNPIEVVTQTELNRRMELMRRKKKQPPAGKKPAAPAVGGSNAVPVHLVGRQSHGDRRVVLQPPVGSGRRALAQTGGQLIDPRRRPPRPRRDLAGDPNKPVLIAPLTRGRGLMVGSEDPEAITLISELVYYLTRPSEGEGNYVVIPVYYADAAEVARVIDELFNGRQQTSSRRFDPVSFFMRSRFGRGDSRDSSSSRGGSSRSTGTVRVVADTRTNSLLVRAPALELTTIRRLLAVSLDVADTDSTAVARTYLIGPLKHASASDIAEILRDLYSSYLTSSGSNNGPGGFPGFSFSRFSRFSSRRSSNTNSNSSRRGPTLAIGVSEVTNQIIVTCPEPMYQQIRNLVEELDQQAAQNSRTMRVVRISNVDPELMQQAIEAITGQGSTSSRSSTSRSRSSSSRSRSDDARRREFFRRLMEERFRRSGGSRSSPFGPRGRSSRSSSPPGGRNFFADRVTEDPKRSASILFDPQQERSTDSGIVQVGLQPPQPVSDSGPRAPRRPITIQVVPGTDQLVIVGDSADVDEVVRIIEQITQLAATAEVEIRLFPLQHADATSVANTLSQVFQQVVVGTAATTRALDQQLDQASILVLPMPRQNAILVGAPRGRMADIAANIRGLDLPISPNARFRTFPLKRANAAQVAATIQQFYQQRYPAEGGTQDQNRLNQIVVEAEASTNTVLVQAAPADLEEIGRLIHYIDTTVSNAVHELRIVPLKNATATDLAAVIQQAISESLTAPTPTTPQAPRPPGVPGQFPGRGGFGGVQQPSSTATAATTGLSLRFMTPDGKPFQSGNLRDVRVTAEPRSNSLIVSAPPETIELIVSLIRQLDQAPPAQAEVKVFTLKKADATSMALLLQQLFYGTLISPTGTTGLGTTGIGGVGGFGQITGQRPQFTTAGTTTEGAALVDVRIAVDQRTNSLIVGASRSDMVLIEAIIYSLDATDIRERRNEVYKLRNTNAIDVANALNEFLRSEINILGLGGEVTPFTQIEREVVVVPEAVSNSLIISATPRFFDEIKNLIAELDQDQPQVVIQVLIAQVRLDGTEEFGVELGLQSPILFQRSVIPASSFFGDGSVTYTTPGQGTSNLVQPGVTVNNSINPAAFQGFNFNNSSVFDFPLGNNPVVRPGVMAPQGLTNFNLGRSSAGAGIGGFVFSAASDSINLLIRALKTQGRLEVLSRPQITALHNQQAFVQVGQQVPIITGVNVSPNVGVTNIVEQTQVGILLYVTPRISPDGYVVMQVQPVVSSISESTVDLGNGVQGTIIDQLQAFTYVSAMDGQTVVIGGLIQKRDEREERKVPWLGDLPYIGAAFRFRSQVKQKSEVLILLTPRVVRNKFEAERVLAEESAKLDWFLGDVEGMMAPARLPRLDHFPPPGVPGGPVPPAVAPDAEELNPPRPLPQPPTTPPPSGTSPATEKDTYSKDTYDHDTYR